MSKIPNILEVDDVAVNVTLIKCLLNRMVCNVFTANSGPEALDIMAKENIDLVLLDIMMPDMDGYEVLTHIREQENTKATPVIMLSALNNNDDVKKAIDLGANDYLSKPVIAPKLIAKINEHLPAEFK